MLKINPARPLDPIALTILQAVKRAAQKSNIAGVRLLGYDVARLAKPENMTKLRNILNDAALTEQLEINMLGNSTDQALDLQKIRQTLTNFRIGMALSMP